VLVISNLDAFFFVVLAFSFITSAYPFSYSGCGSGQARQAVLEDFGPACDI
jgi:hypothetical protein